MNLDFSVCNQVPDNRTMQSLSSTEKNFNKERELSEYDETFRIFMNTIKQELETRNLKEVADWIDKALHYNVRHPKRNRGIALVQTFRLVASESEVNPNNLKLARLLGWCLEMFEAALTILDDVMDGSLTRHGQDCWYRVKEVGINSVNDSLLLDKAVFIILKLHFSHLPCYLDLIETFQDLALLTCSGQCLDMTLNDSKPNLDSFTPERYASIFIHKAVTPLLFAPVKIGLILACKKEVFTKDIEDLLINIGHYFQAQNDIFDCYPKVSGSIGRDIEDGKCTWLIITAYNKASPNDKIILQENYGVNCKEAASKVKQIYNKLNILSQFKNDAPEMYANIAKRIKEVTEKSQIPGEYFFALLDEIHNQNK